VGQLSADIDLFSLLLRLIFMLERRERLAGLPAKRADERTVVLVGDLACAMVELELLQRGEGAIALLEEPQARLLLRAGCPEIVLPGRRGTQERHCDEDDARDG